MRIGGYDVRQLQLDSVRRAIAKVPQDMVLFNDTIMYNIAYGKQGATKVRARGCDGAAQTRTARRGAFPLGKTIPAPHPGSAMAAYLACGSPRARLAFPYGRWPRVV